MYKNSYKIPNDILESLTKISSKHCLVKSLIPQGRDCFDFHDVGVVGLRDALYEAFLMGIESSYKKKRSKI